MAGKWLANGWRVAGERMASGYAAGMRLASSGWRAAGVQQLTRGLRAGRLTRGLRGASLRVASERLASGWRVACEWLASGLRVACERLASGL